MQVLAPAKQQYGVQDLQRWAKIANTSLTWPDFFPLNSVLPLRVTLAADCNERLINILCEYGFLSFSVKSKFAYRQVSMAR